MGNRYVVARANITPVAGQDILQLLSASARRFRIVEVSIAGLGASSAAQALYLGRATGGTTPGGPIVLSKYEHTEQPAPVTVANTTWSVQPTLDTNFVVIGWNALGPGFWRAPQAPQGIRNFEARNAEFLSLRCPSAGVVPQAMSLSVIIDED